MSSDTVSQTSVPKKQNKKSQMHFFVNLLIVIECSTSYSKYTITNSWLNSVT